MKSGERVKDTFILYEKTLAQKKNGDNYLSVKLSDKTGRIDGVVWDDVDRINGGVRAGDYVIVEAGVSAYRGNLQLVIKSMTACPSDQIDPSDYLPCTERNIEDMFERLIRLTDDLQNRYLKTLLRQFWEDDDFVSGFKRAPAAKLMHHDYIGGLLEHTYSMALLVKKIAGHYSGVDIDLLMTGAILHDIGKIKEFEYESKIDYSTAGRLLNHIVLGCAMVDKKLMRIEDFPEELADLLRHMIVSHHGQREFGSPEPPKTIEAVILNYIDEIDAKVNGIRSFINKEDNEEEWTSFHRIFGRHFYKGQSPDKE